MYIAASENLYRIKQAMALAASRAIVKTGGGRMLSDLTAVEEAVEEAALEMGLQTEIHQERGSSLQCATCKRPYGQPHDWRKHHRPRHHVFTRRTHYEWSRHLTLRGLTGTVYRGRAQLWSAKWAREWERAEKKRAR